MISDLCTIVAALALASPQDAPASTSDRSGRPKITGYRNGPQPPRSTVTSSAAKSDPIVVTGTRRQRRQRTAPISTEVLSRFDIERSGARNLAEALEAMPGLRITPDVTGAVQIQLRGFDADHVLVLIDGQRISGRKNGAVDLTRLGIEPIERIEIVKGPASALYGADALGGVINIITRGPDAPLQGSVRVSYGAAPDGDPFDDLSVEAESFEVSGRVAGTAGDFGWQSTAGFRRRNPFDLTPDTPSTTGAGFEDFDTQFRGSYGNDDFEFRLRFEGGTRSVNAIESSPILDDGRQAIYDRAQRINTIGVHAQPVFKIGGGNLTLNYSFSMYDESFERDQRDTERAGTTTRESLSDGITEALISYDRAVFGSQHIMIGAEFFHQFLNATRFPSFEDRFRVSPSSMSPVARAPRGSGTAASTQKMATSMLGLRLDS